MRIFISMLQEEPHVYIITKVDNTSPKGVITFTVKQDRYEPLHDYVCLDPDCEDYGDMYADYYSSDVIPEEHEENIINKEHYTMVIESSNYNVRIGTSKVLSVKIYDADNKDITNEYSKSECVWNFRLENAEEIQDKLIVVDKDYSLKDGNEFKCKFKFNGDEKYLGHNINVGCKIENMSAEISLDIIAL
jgi:hypothetical protein